MHGTHRFKTPEGRYELVHERTQGLVPFHYQRSTRLTLANLQAGGAEDGSYVIFNVGELVHIARRNATHKVRAGWPRLARRCAAWEGPGDHLFSASNMWC